MLAVVYIYQFHSELFQRWRHDHEFFLVMKAWIKGGMADKEREPYLAALVLPSREAGDERQPVQGAAGLESTYPDPATPGIFWIAPLFQGSGPLAPDTPSLYVDLLNLDSLPQGPSP